VGRERRKGEVFSGGGGKKGQKVPFLALFALKMRAIREVGSWEG
jgi:hypothetical protein